MAYIGKNPRLKSIVSEGDTLANLTAEPRVAGRLVYATDTQQFYYDDGTSLTAISGGAGGALEVLDEGSSLSAAVESIDFVGAGVTATTVGNDITVTIPGGGAGGGVTGLATSIFDSVPQLSGASDRRAMGAAYGNGTYVVAGDSNSGVGVAFVGSNLSNLEPVAWTNNMRSQGGIDFGNGVFVASGFQNNTSNRMIIRSTDNGQTWADTSPSNSTWFDLAYGNGTWVVGSFTGTNYAYSTDDGLTWTEVAAPESIWFVEFGNGIFVATNGNAAADGRVMTSPDGINWTKINVPLKNYRKAAFGNGVWVVVNNSGGILYSTDNWATFTELTGGIADRALTSVAFADGYFLAKTVSGIPTLIKSADGITWEYGINLSTSQEKLRSVNNTFITTEGTASSTLFIKSSFPGPSL